VTSLAPISHPAEAPEREKEAVEVALGKYAIKLARDAMVRALGAMAVEMGAAPA